jgi:protein-S-isoprenylcysteine O-methyltransferase Ste14
MKKNLSTLLIAFALFTTSFNALEASPLLFFAIGVAPTYTMQNVDNQSIKKEKVSAFKEALNTVKANKALLLTMGVFAFGAFVKKKLKAKREVTVGKVFVWILILLLVVAFVIGVVEIVKVLA